MKVCDVMCVRVCVSKTMRNISQRASTFVVSCETLIVSGITLIHCHLSNLLERDVLSVV